jgi:hypothetical protein
MDDGSDAHSRLDFCPKLGCQSPWYLTIRQDATAHVMEPLAPSGGTGGSQQDLWDPRQGMIHGTPLTLGGSWGPIPTTHVV